MFSGVTRIDLIVRHVSYFKFASGLLSLTSMQLLFLETDYCVKEACKKNPGLERDLNPWPRDTGAML